MLARSKRRLNQWNTSFVYSKKNKFRKRIYEWQYAYRSIPVWNHVLLLIIKFLSCKGDFIVCEREILCFLFEIHFWLRGLMITLFSQLEQTKSDKYENDKQSLLFNDVFLEIFHSKIFLPNNRELISVVRWGKSQANFARRSPTFFQLLNVYNVIPPTKFYQLFI